MIASPHPLPGLPVPLRPAFLHALLREDFCAFVERVFVTVVPGECFQPNWHIEAICHALDELAAGHRQRQIIAMPPRSLKSIIASVALPAWILGRDPTQKIVCVSYSDELALKHARDFRLVVNSDWYRRTFPNMRIDRVTDREITTSRRGGRYAVSVQGTITGRGGNLIILDDPMKPGDAASKQKREAINEWIRTTLPSRLDDKRTGRMLIVMQRVHIDDPIGVQLRLGGWDRLCLPAIAEREQRIPVGRGRVHTRMPGDLLQPVREPLPVLDRLRLELGSSAFSAQYQQAPVPAEGNLIKKEWLQFYEAPPRGGRIIQSWDTAATADAHSDYSVCTTWQVVDGRFYLLSVFRRKLLYPDLRAHIISERERWGAETVIIEAAGTGLALIEDLRRQGVPVVPFKPKQQTKEERLQVQSTKFEGGLVLLPRRAPWLDEYVDELLGFPGLAHDDQVDSTSQALAWWDGRHRGSSIGTFRF